MRYIDDRPADTTSVMAIEVSVGDTICEELSNLMVVAEVKIGGGSFPSIYITTTSGKRLEYKVDRMLCRVYWLTDIRKPYDPADEELGGTPV